MRFLMAAALAVTFFVGSAFAQDKIALVIGNGEYKGGVSRLDNAVDDAELMAETLEYLGFEVQLRLNVTNEQMKSAFKKHTDRLSRGGPDAVGVFYFAGHGVQAGGSNFLIPIGAQPVIVQDLYGEAPTLQRFVHTLRKVGNETNFFIIDACRDNPLSNAGWNVPTGLAQPKRMPGQLFAFSTGAGEVAMDGAGYPNSPYTRALSRWMTEPGLVIETMFKRVARQVFEETEGGQTPYEVNGIFHDDIYLAGELKKPTEEEYAAFYGADTPCDYAEFVLDFPDSALTGRAAALSARCVSEAPEIVEISATTAPTYDRIGSDFDFGTDNPVLTGDGLCSDPRFTGPGMSAAPWRASMKGQDASDCETAWDAGTLLLRTAESLGIASIGQVHDGIDFGTDDSNLANDGLCSDNRFTGSAMASGVQLMEMQEDRSDCLVAYLAGTIQPNPQAEL